MSDLQQSLIETLLGVTVTATWALPLAWLICRLPRLSPSACSWVWRFAYLRLLLAVPSWSISLPLLPAQPPQGPAVAAVAGSAPPAAVEPEGNLALQLLLCLWLLWAGCAAVRIAVELCIASRLRMGSRRLAVEGPSAILRELGRRLEIRRLPDLREADVAGPLLLGWRRPAILLPRGCEFWTDSHLRLALAHELAHLRRGDPLWCWLPVLIRIVGPFHPMLRWAESEWRFWQEAAADELALRATGEKPGALARLLIDVAAGALPHRLPAGVLPALPQTPRMLERRVREMNKKRDPRSNWMLIAAGAAGAAVLMPFQITARAEDRPAEAEKREMRVRVRTSEREAVRRPGRRPAQIHPPARREARAQQPAQVERGRLEMEKLRLESQLRQLNRTIEELGGSAPPASSEEMTDRRSTSETSRDRERERERERELLIESDGRVIIEQEPDGTKIIRIPPGGRGRLHAPAIDFNLRRRSGQEPAEAALIERERALAQAERAATEALDAVIRQRGEVPPEARREALERLEAVRERLRERERLLDATPLERREQVERDRELLLERRRARPGLFPRAELERRRMEARERSGPAAEAAEQARRRRMEALERMRGVRPRGFGGAAPGGPGVYVIPPEVMERLPDDVKERLRPYLRSGSPFGTQVRPELRPAPPRPPAGAPRRPELRLAPPARPAAPRPPAPPAALEEAPPAELAAPPSDEVKPE